MSHRAANRRLALLLLFLFGGGVALATPLDAASTGLGSEVPGRAVPGAVSAEPQAADSSLSELRLTSTLIEGFLRVIYFGAEDARFHFREYSTCSYEFIQNPSVSLGDGLIRVSAEFYRRRGTEALGGCVGGPAIETIVMMSARPFAQGTAVGLEITEVTTETLPELTSALLGLAGVELPMTHTFDLMGAMNGMLRETQPFGIASMEIHEVLPADDSILLRLTMQLGIW